jgi:hypothetical protein
LGTFILYSARSFAALGNYADLEYASRNALDRMTWRVRQANRLTDYTPTQLTFEDSDGQPLQFRYDPVAQTFRRVKSGDNALLLQNCTNLRFDIFQRNTTNATYNQFPTATNTPQLCKVVQITWTCSRKLFGSSLFNTEVVQTAKIVIRKS